MYRRQLTPELLDAADHYPVATLLGPRQSGKTTLVQQAFPNKQYVNLELPDQRELATVDPRAFLAQYPEGAIFDEIQRAPTLLSYIQVIVDARRSHGMFILTGSHQLELPDALAQSLAGRTALLDLLPMSLEELQEAGFSLNLDEAILYGGYPRIFHEKLNPTKAYRDYFRTYVERDLRQLIHVKDLSQFQRFMRLCAGRIGQLVNFESLSNDVGVSSTTIKQWISILEASFIITRVVPYFENLGKRIVKSPKLYFTDVGLASYLLGLQEANHIQRDPLRGNLVENLVVTELLKARLNRGLDPNLYFFRDAHGHEVDLIFQNGRNLIPIEIKAAQTFHSDFLKNLRFFKSIAGERSPTGFLIYAGPLEQQIENFQLLNYTNAQRALG